MYTIDTSIHRLLGDKLITTFTYNKLWALSLFTVGDLQAMGIKKLWAIPGIGLKVINDVEHDFITTKLLYLQKRILRINRSKNMLIYVRMLEIARNFRQYSLLR